MNKSILFSILLVLFSVQLQAEEPSIPQPQAVLIAGCPNVFAATGELLSGGQPHGEEAFKALAEAGVKTMISVDGARPDVEGARKFGLRYVHLPIGYDGLTQEQSLSLARAVRDLPGKFYIHCHHGKHRSPAALASILVSSHGWKNDHAVNFMKLAGTSPNYVGLYKAIKTGKAVDSAALDQADASFPEIAKVPDIVEMMVQAEHRLDALLTAKANRWAPSPDHPDVLPQHEALQLMELFQEGLRLDDIPENPQYKAWMMTSRDAALDLQKALHDKNLARADELLSIVSKTCSACHEKFRNSQVLR